MSYAKLASTLAVFSALTFAAQAAPVAHSAADAGIHLGQHQPVQWNNQWNDDWRERRWREREWRRERDWRRPDPVNACRNAAGDMYRMPAKDFGQIDMRPVGGGNMRVTVAGRGVVVNCIVDEWGNVRNVR